MANDLIKEYYQESSETNWTKRFNSPFPTRKYYFNHSWNQVINLIPPGTKTVLDAGCGDGVLAVLIAKHFSDIKVIATDISPEAVERTKAAAEQNGVGDRVTCQVGDSENLPFADHSIEFVVSNHVLEHLPDFKKGLAEFNRVMQTGGVIGLPCCFNMASAAMLGRDTYWKLRLKSFFAIAIGSFRIFWALITGKDGVDEGYAGHRELPHLRYFPWHAVKKVKENGLNVLEWQADSLLLPYLADIFPGFIRFQKILDKNVKKLVWKIFGVGVLIQIRRNN